MTNDDFRDVRRLIGSVNPVPSGEFPDGAHQAQAREALHRLLRHEAPPQASPARLRSLPSLSRRRFVAVGAGAVATAAAGLAVATWPAPDRVIRTPVMLDYRLTGANMSLPAQSASDLLTTLAVAAERQSVPSPRPADAYSLVVTNEWELSVAIADQESTAALTPVVIKRWTPRTAPGLIRRLERRGRPEVFEAGSPQTAAAVSSVTPLVDEQYPAGRAVAPWPDALDSATPAQLRQALTQDHPGPMTYTLIRSIRMLHAHHVVTPRLAARLWRLLAEQPDLSPAGEVTDRAGRRGVAIAYHFDLSLPKKWVLILDPGTGTLLGIEEILTTEPGKLNVRVPAVTRYTLFLSQRWTETAAE